MVSGLNTLEKHTIARSLCFSLWYTYSSRI